MSPTSLPSPCRNPLLQLIDQQAELYLVVIDDSGRVRYANQFACRLAGGPLVGQPLSDQLVLFGAPFDPATLLENYQRSAQPQALTVQVANDLPRTFYFRLQRQDGDLLLLGEINGDDIALLRRNLIEANNELSNLTRQYQKANSELTKLNQQKNHFLGVAAHDLRNPLASILAYCDFLLEDIDQTNDEQIRFVQIIQNSSHYMLGLLEKLLDIARIEAGKLKLEMQPTALDLLIRNNLDINRPLAQKKGIALQFHSHESVPPLRLDPMKIEQVLNNLLSNAIKFSHSGSTIRVELFRTGDCATVAVHDQGIGIATKDLAQLFQPFTTLNARGTAGETTTGLGLAIVQKIITGHQGRIWVESHEGRGTSFFFSLPLTGTEI